jgi:hypothetical protein
MGVAQSLLCTLMLYAYIVKNRRARNRSSRTVMYASTCPSLRAGTSDVLLRVFPRHRHATLGYIWSIDSIGTTTLPYNFEIYIRMAQSLLISKYGRAFRVL